GPGRGPAHGRGHGPGAGRPAPARSRRPLRPAGQARDPGLALAAAAAPPPDPRRPQLEAAGTGHAVGLDALRPEPGPADRGLAAGQCRRRRAGHGRVRPRHLAGDAAADLDRRVHGPVAAAPGAAHLAGPAGAVRGPADHGRAVADAGPGPAWAAGRAGLPAGRRLSRRRPYSRTQSRPAILARYRAASAAPVQLSKPSRPGPISATPMLRVTGWPAPNTQSRTAWPRRRARSSAASRAVPGSSTPNSSPPKRPAESPPRRPCSTQLATLRITSSPARWPSASLIRLKWSMSSISSEATVPWRR